MSQITSEDGGLVLETVLEQGVLHIGRSRGNVAEGRVQELWLIVGGAAPVSLGVLSNGSDAVLQVPAEIGTNFWVRFWRSVTNPLVDRQPTGAVLAIGSIREI